MLTNAILEKPIPFTLNGRYFFLYQPSLGVSLLAGQLLQQLQINPQLYSTNKQMEMLRADEGRGEQTAAVSPEDFMVDARLNDYQLILADLNKAADLAPDFAYTYYNRGNVLSGLKDYRAAIVSYNEAIALEPNLAEAYYNRGLTYIFLGENARGVADLSKAGELGLYSAYNLIKRFAE